jgi:hypothetical protein
MTNKLDLNIAKECLENWEIHHAIREIIANAIDEHSECEIKKPITINIIQNKCEIIDYGRGLKIDNFIQKINKTKTTKTNFIGQFGIGLKDCLGVLCKNDIDVKIFTQEYKYTSLYLEKPGTNIHTLHVEYIKNPEKNIDYGTKFILTNINKKDIIDAKNYFIDYTTNQYIKFTDSIYKFDKKQFIFVNGMKTSETKNMYFSYNIKKTKELKELFNRDRDDKDYQLFKKNIENILQNVKLNNNCKDLINQLIKILAEKNLKEFNQIDIIRNILNQLNETDKYIFIDIIDKNKIREKIYSDKIRNSKREIIFLGQGVKTKLGYKTKNIKSLCEPEKISSPKRLNGLFTLSHETMFPPLRKKEFDTTIKEFLEKLKSEYSIEIPTKIENVLKNIEIIDENIDNNNDNNNDDDDKLKKNNNDFENSDSEDSENSDNSDIDDIDDLKDSEYKFDDDTFRIKSYLINNPKHVDKLNAIIFNYILNNVANEERIQIIEQVIIKNRQQNKTNNNSFGFLSMFTR